MRETLLVVEDNTELLELLRLALKDAGYRVVTACNGTEALEKARSVMPDLVLLDLVLPELDGFAVCEALRQNASTKTIPILMVTGLTSELSRYAGMESGADEYVTKPVSSAQLLSKIEYWLGTRQAKPHPEGQRRPGAITAAAS